MKRFSSIPQQHRGSSLVETVIAMGVLAVAFPLVFGALAESGKSGMSSEAETRSTWMIPICMEEIRASRNGKPEYFTATTVGQVIPASGGIWALAFSPDGKPVGKLDKAVYDKGAKQLGGKTISYIASISAEPIPAAQKNPDKPGEPDMMRARISLEYPATSPATKRQKLEFYTRIP
jgi:hypothetical protein